MTREEQRILREWKKPFAQACRTIGRAHGWKRGPEVQYRVINGFLYDLYLLPRWREGVPIAAACLRAKPLVIDELFWELFHVEEAREKPFSFHINGGLTPWALTLERWSRPVSLEELASAIEAFFEEADTYLAEKWAFPDLAAFRRAAAQREEPGIHQELNILLCLLCEGRYEEAMKQIEAALERGDNGGYVDTRRNRNILEDARDWCAARLEAS